MDANENIANIVIAWAINKTATWKRAKNTCSSLLFLINKELLPRQICSDLYTLWHRCNRDVDVVFTRVWIQITLLWDIIPLLITFNVICLISVNLTAYT